jgi:5,5'-dehydrodivanillate O-demethylase
MLTTEENERLTRVGPGTPAGTLLRRYWFPVAAVAEMADRWTKRVKIMDEELVLYKTRAGAFGLIAEACPHRRASLAYGIPTQDGIRCPYHGWQFDGTGRCTEQPNEPEGSVFKDKIATAGYPVEELGGLLWGYLGPAPAPLVPRYDAVAAPRAIRTIGKATINCNWLQIMENSVDPVHTEWLHGALYEFIHERDNVKVAIAKHHLKIAFDEFEHGIVKRRLVEGQTEDASDWRVGHPVVFPNILAVSVGYGPAWISYELQFRVPIDDQTTEHYWYNAFVPAADTPIPAELLDRVSVYDVPVRGLDGERLLEYIHGQDALAWETQGRIASRDLEHLASTDRGVTMLRRMVANEIKQVEAGMDPMCVVRDPQRNRMIDLPFERNKHMNSDGFELFMWRTQMAFSPITKDVIAVWNQQFERIPVAL